MCGRFVLQTPAETLQRLFHFAPPPPSWEPERSDRARFNIAPTQPILVVRGGAERRGDWAAWGLSAARGRLAINARSETGSTRPAFREGLRHRRVLVPADGFLEWVVDPSGKRLPRWLRPVSGSPVAFAGVLGPLRTKMGERSGCAILTTAANDEVSAVHDRMPVVLPASAWDRWLAEDTSLESVLPLLVPAPSGSFEVVPVSSRVNKVEHDDPACLEPPATGEVLEVSLPPIASRRRRTVRKDPRQLGFGF